MSAVRLMATARSVPAATGLESLHALPARHFLHEDQAGAVAELVVALAQRVDGGD